MNKASKKGVILLCLLTFLLFSITMVFGNGGASSNSTSTSEWRMDGRTLDHMRFYPDSIDLSNFGVIWSYETNYSSQAIVKDGVVYFTKITWFPSDDNCLMAINATNGNQIWNYTLVDGFRDAPTLSDDMAYFGALDYNMHAVNITNGEHVWNFTTASFLLQSPIVNDGILYTQDGTDDLVYALNATNGSQIWNYSSECGGTAALYNDKLYVVINHGFIALNATNGSLIWSSSVDNISNKPAVFNDIVYAVSSDNHTFALNATDGSEIWNYTTDAKIYAPPAISPFHGGIVYVYNYYPHMGTSTGNNLYALNATTGEKLWNYSTSYIGGDIFLSPIVANETVVLGTIDNRLVILDALTGGLVFEYDVGGNVTAAPTIADGVIYLSVEYEKLYAIGSRISNITTSPAVPFTNNGSYQDLAVSFNSPKYPINITFYLYNESGMLPVDVPNTTYTWSTNNFVDGPTTINSAADLPIYFTINVGLENGNHSINMTVSDSDLYEFNITIASFYANDTTPPDFPEVGAAPHPTESTIQPSWSSSEPSLKTFSYGTDYSLGSNVSNSQAWTFTNLAVSSLTPNMTYYYNLTSCDLKGNCDRTGYFNFTTYADTAPIISGISIDPPLPTVNNGTIQYLGINFTLDKFTGNDSFKIYYNDTNSLVYVGGDDKIYPFSYTSPTYNYTIPDTLDNGTYSLKYFISNSLYNTSSAIIGNIEVNYTGPIFFYNVSVHEIDDSSVTFNLSTNKITNASINYGETTDLGNITSNSTYDSSNLHHISNLDTNTLYFYNITSCTHAGNCNTTGPYNFTTKESNYGIHLQHDGLMTYCEMGSSCKSSFGLLNNGSESFATYSGTLIEYEGIRSSYCNQCSSYFLGSGGWDNSSEVNVLIDYIGDYIIGVQIVCDQDSNVNATLNITYRIGPKIGTEGKTASMRFDSKEPVNYTFEYGETTDLGNITSNSTYLNDSYINIFNLTTNTTYYYNFTYCNSTENCVRLGTYNFTTKDYIYSVSASSSAATYTKIQFLAADAISNYTLNFGETIDLGDIYTGDMNPSYYYTYSSLFDLKIDNLTPNTTYYYNITVCNTTSFCATRGPYNYTTFEPTWAVYIYPEYKIYFVNISNVKIIRSGEESTKEIVFYNYGTMIDNYTLDITNYDAIEKAQFIQTRFENIEYTLGWWGILQDVEINISEDNIGDHNIGINITSETNSSIYNDTALVVHVIPYHLPTENSALIRWHTDQLSNSTINYGTSTSLGTVLTKTDFATNQTNHLQSLDSNTKYFYNVTWCYSGGNCSTWGPYNFTTEPPCTEDWSDWSSWSTCVNSQQSRTRTKTCYGWLVYTDTETQSCFSGGGYTGGVYTLPPTNETEEEPEEEPSNETIWTPELPNITLVNVTSEIPEVTVTNQSHEIFTPENDSIGIVWENMTEEDQVGIEINSTEIPVDEIIFRIRNRKTVQAKLTIKVMNQEVPDIVRQNMEEHMQKKIYKYFEINKTNIEDDDFDGNITIKFKVEKQWLQQNNMSADEVVLWRHDGVQWMQLLTLRTSENDIYHFYEASCPGFSIFAIGESEAAEEEVPISNIIWLIPITLVIGIFVVVLFYFKSKQTKEYY